MIVTPLDPGALNFSVQCPDKQKQSCTFFILKSTRSPATHRGSPTVGDRDHLVLTISTRLKKITLLDTVPSQLLWMVRQLWHLVLCKTICTTLGCFRNDKDRGFCVLQSHRAGELQRGNYNYRCVKTPTSESSGSHKEPSSGKLRWFQSKPQRNACFLAKRSPTTNRL